MIYVLDMMMYDLRCCRGHGRGLNNEERLTRIGGEVNDEEIIS